MSIVAQMSQRIQELEADNEKLLRTMRLHAGDCCSLNNEVELFRCHWEDAEQICKELERENRRLKIRLDQYDADATDLIEEHGADPDDKIDREVLKRMLNCLIGKNRTLTNKSKELEEEIKVQKLQVILSESQNYCKICGNTLDGYIPPEEKK